MTFPFRSFCVAALANLLSSSLTDRFLAILDTDIWFVTVSNNTCRTSQLTTRTLQSSRLEEEPARRIASICRPPTRTERSICSRRFTRRWSGPSRSQTCAPHWRRQCSWPNLRRRLLKRSSLSRTRQRTRTLSGARHCSRMTGIISQFRSTSSAFQRLPTPSASARKEVKADSSLHIVIVT